MFTTLLFYKAVRLAVRCTDLRNCGLFYAHSTRICGGIIIRLTLGVDAALNVCNLYISKR